MRRIAMGLAVIAVLGCQSRSAPRATEEPAAFVPESSPEAAPAADATSSRLRFTCDVLRALRAVHDTKAGDAGARDAEQQASQLAERLDRSGRQVQQLMEPWIASPDARIQDYAREVEVAGRDLCEMAAAGRDLIAGSGDADRLQGVVTARKEDLGQRVMMPAAMVAGRDPGRRFSFTAAEKKEILDLIENQLFPREVGAFDVAGDAERRAFAEHPELMAVFTFRSTFRSELQ